MEIVKLKKGVDFSVLLEYGFKYNKDTNRYERQSKWTLENVCHQLVVDIETRDVYMDIRTTNDTNELFKGTDSALYNTTLVKLSPYLEIVEDFNSSDSVPYIKGE